MMIMLGLAALALLDARPALAQYNCLGRNGESSPYLMSSNPNPFARVLDTDPLTGSTPVVFILIENPMFGVPFRNELRDPVLWNKRIGEIDKYYNEVSIGRLRFTPALETYGTLNDGIIGPLMLNDLQSTATSRNSDDIAIPAIRASDPYINFRSYDRNLDGVITADELHLVIVQAGYEQSYDKLQTPQPCTWQHSRWWTAPPLTYDTPWPNIYNPLPRIFTDNVLITSYQYLGSEFFRPNTFTPMMTTLGPFVHQMAHDLGLPDLSTSTTMYYNSIGNLGNHCLLSTGMWGGNGGVLPVHINGYFKSFLGWSQVIQVTAPTNKVFSLPATMGSNQMVQIAVPGSSNEFFVVENRQKIGYDAGLPGPAKEGGLAIYHMNRSGLGYFVTSSTIGWIPYNGIVLEQADGSTSLSTGLTLGTDKDYFRAGHKTVFNDLSIPNSNLYTSASSQVEISNISASGPQMTFEMGHGNQISFARTALSVNESQGNASIVVNLNRPGENEITVDYGVVAATATGNGVDYNLTPGKLVFAPGQTSKYFNMQLVDDAVANEYEYVVLGLSNPHGAILNESNSRAFVTIVDNDNPKLNVAKPNGGEVLNRGFKYRVEWITNPADVGSLVRLDLFKDDVYYKTLSSPTYIPNTSNRNYNTSYTVTIPSNTPVGFRYKIRLSTPMYNGVFYSDQSDGYFSILDPNLVVSSLKFNGGAGQTTSRLVTLNITTPAAPTEVSQFMASESSTFTGAKWLTFTANPQFTLSAGDGWKRVYVKIRNSAGQESPAKYASIYLKDIPVKPEIQPIPEQTAYEHSAFTGPVPKLVVTNPPAAVPVSWSLVSGPPGMLINPANGQVKWPDPRREYSPALIRIRARNAGGYSDVSWQLNVRPGDLAQAVNQPTWKVNNSGDVNWYFQTSVTHDKMHAARTGKLANSQTAVMTASVTGPGVIGFWWKVSSQLNADKLSFKLGSTVLTEISGEKDWVYYRAAVPVGTFTLSWTYAKDASGVSGLDAAFVDDVTWQPGLRVTNMSRSNYRTFRLKTFARPWYDSNVHFLDPIPEIFRDQAQICTYDADRNSSGNAFLSFTVDRPVYVVIGMDPNTTTLPSWLTSYTKLTKYDLRTEIGSLKLYARYFPAGKVTLGGNTISGNSGGKHMYSVLLLPVGPVNVHGISNPLFTPYSLKAGQPVLVALTNTWKDPIPWLFQGATSILTAQADAATVGNNIIIGFNVDVPVTVVLGFDARIPKLPSWASSWQPVGDQLFASDGTRKLYAKRFDPGRVFLRGNLEPGTIGSYRMYSVHVLQGN